MLAGTKLCRVRILPSLEGHARTPILVAWPVGLSPEAVSRHFHRTLANCMWISTSNSRNDDGAELWFQLASTGHAVTPKEIARLPEALSGDVLELRCPSMRPPAVSDGRTPLLSHESHRRAKKLDLARHRAATLGTSRLRAIGDKSGVGGGRCSENGDADGGSGSAKAATTMTAAFSAMEAMTLLETTTTW